MKYLLVEDDCSPDSRQHFMKQFFELTGEELYDWIDNAETITEPEYTKYQSNKYILEISADEPQYRLSLNKQL